MEADVKVISEYAIGSFSRGLEIRNDSDGSFWINSYRMDSAVHTIIVTKEDVQAMMDYINSKGVK